MSDPTARVPPGRWTIGILHGPSPVALGVVPQLPCPAFTAAAVTDVSARFVADPFLLRRNGIWFLFFEAFDEIHRRGVIAAATSPDLRTWSYRGVVLDEPFHLSYPHVLEWQGEIYMVPETLAPQAVRLYRSTSFPAGWVHETDLLSGAFADSTLFRHAGLWWMLTCSRPRSHDRLELFFAADLAGPWRAHPANPVVADDVARARPAGRVVSHGGTLLRFAQDCASCYGHQVRAFEILELSTARYREREHDRSPVLRPGACFPGSRRVHHVDPQPFEDGWVACVDVAY